MGVRGIAGFKAQVCRFGGGRAKADRFPQRHRLRLSRWSSPLNIADISFTPPPNPVNMAFRLPPPHDSSYLPGPPVRWSPHYPLGGGGLFGSAPSFLRLLQHLLPTAPATLLAADSRARMFAPQLATTRQRADVARFCQAELHPWSRDGDVQLEGRVDWGLGGALLTEALPSGRHKGSMCWSGMAVSLGQHVGVSEPERMACRLERMSSADLMKTWLLVLSGLEHVLGSRPRRRPCVWSVPARPRTRPHRRHC